MLDGLQRLIELQKLDDELNAYAKEHENIPNRREGFVETRNACEASLGEAEESRVNAEADLRRAEQNHQDNVAQLQKLEGQQFQVKSNDVYTALLHEMDSARDAISECETQILEAMEQIEAGGLAKQKVESEVSATRKQVEDDARTLDAREKVLDSEIQRLGRDREALCSEVDRALLARYSRIASRRTPVIALVKSEMCAGCRVGIPAQDFIEILRGESIIVCGNCQRMLMHDPSAEAARAAEK